MISLRSGLAVIVALLLLGGCDEAVQPKTDFVERLVLYGIATSSNLGDISQKIIIERTYDIDGLALPDTSSDQGIPGSTVVLTVDGREYTLQDSVFTFRQAGGDILTRRIYTAAGIRFMAQQRMSVRAALPDGRTLSAETVAPPFYYFESSYPFSSGITTAVRGQAGDTWSLRWDGSTSHLYWPRLIIRYQRDEPDSSRTTRSIEVPLTFADVNGTSEAVYPTRTWTPSSSFTFDAIDSAMARISEGDTLKSRYRILGATFTVTTYDPHLARYYTSLHGSVSEFSIRSDPAFYTNVNGGIGILGSITSSTFEFLIHPTYARSFGYQSSG